MSLKEPARVVWQAGDCQHHGYQAEGVLVFDGELYVLVALGNGATEPHHRLGLVTGHSQPRQIQHAQHILSMLIARLCRLCELIHRTPPLRYSLPSR